MPWRETNPVPARVQCMAAYLSQCYSMTALCARVGIRRNTGYQWVRRYTAEGLVGLQEKSRVPHGTRINLSNNQSVALSW